MFSRSRLSFVDVSEKDRFEPAQTNSVAELPKFLTSTKFCFFFKKKFDDEDIL